MRFTSKLRRSARAVETETRHLTFFGDLGSTWQRGMVYDYFSDQEQDDMLRMERQLAERSAMELEVAEGSN